MRKIVLTAVNFIVLTAHGHAAAQVTAGAEKAAGIARADFVARVEREFADTDADKNGKVSAAEIGSFRRARRIQRAQQANAARFAELDKDKNGWLDRQEFAALIPETPVLGGGPLVSRFDSNKDGVLSLDEYRTGSLGDFGRLDADKDGNLSPVEVKAGRAKPGTE